MSEPNRVEIEEFNRWAAPLNDGIAFAGVHSRALATASGAIAAPTSAENGETQ